MPAGFEGLDDPPGLFILCGNFMSPTSGALNVAALKAHFTSLAHILLSFSGLLVRIATNTTSMQLSQSKQGFRH